MSSCIMMLYCLYYCTYDKITCSKLQAFVDQVTMLPLRVLFGVTLALASPDCEVGWGYEGRGEPSSPNLRWNSAPKMSPGMAKPLGFQFQEAVLSRNFHDFPWISFMATCKKDMLIHSVGYRWMGNLAEAYLGLLIRSSMFLRSAVTVGDTQGDFKSLGRYQHQEF